VKAIAAGRQSTIALKANGSIRWWGSGNVIFPGLQPWTAKNVISINSAGAVIAVPSLEARYSTGQFSVSWAEVTKGYKLESSVKAGEWIAVTNSVTRSNGKFTTTVPSSSSHRLFRLVQ
jgi:hypothetical protein